MYIEILDNYYLQNEPPHLFKLRMHIKYRKKNLCMYSYCPYDGSCKYYCKHMVIYGFFPRFNSNDKEEYYYICCDRNSGIMLYISKTFNNFTDFFNELKEIRRMFFKKENIYMVRAYGFEYTKNLLKKADDYYAIIKDRRQ